MGGLVTTPLRTGTRCGWRLLFIGGALLVLVFTGCTMPNHIALSNELGAAGTKGSTTALVGSGSAQLHLEGRYELQEGSLRMRITRPDGSQAYAETYAARSEGVVDTLLERLPGEWVIEATTTPGHGSYDIGLSF